MSNKNKTVSFRVNEDLFEELSELAEEKDLSLSALFREYVEAFVTHEGAVEVVPEDAQQNTTSAFPPTVSVPTSFIREHDRLELEVDHLNEQLEEHKEYIAQLQKELETVQTQRQTDIGDDIVHLDELDSANNVTESTEDHLQTE